MEKTKGPSLGKPLPAGEISRAWSSYMVKAVFSEAKAKESGAPWPEVPPAQIAASLARLAKGVEGQVFALPAPIVVQTSEVKSIVTVKVGEKSLRFYPPFPLNEKGGRVPGDGVGGSGVGGPRAR